MLESDNIAKDKVFEDKFKTLIKAHKFRKPRYKRVKRKVSMHLISENHVLDTCRKNIKNLLSLEKQYQENWHEVYRLKPILVLQKDFYRTYDFTVKESMYHPSFYDDYLISYKDKITKVANRAYRIHQIPEKYSEMSKDDVTDDVLFFDEDDLHKCLSIYAIAVNNNRFPSKLIRHIEFDNELEKVAYRHVLTYWEKINLKGMLNDVISTYLAEFYTRNTFADYTYTICKDDGYIIPFRKDFEYKLRIYTVVCPFPVLHTYFTYNYRNNNNDPFITDITFVDFRIWIAKILEYGFLQMSKDQFLDTIQSVLKIRREIVKEIAKETNNKDVDTNTCEGDE